MKRRFDILMHPLFLTALMALIINDHLLKDIYPSVLTGKLSDFAGLFVFPIFLSTLLPRSLQATKALLTLYIAVAIAFTCWKIAPVEIPLNWISSTTGLPTPHRTKDVTDLVALIILPLSLYFLQTRPIANPAAYAMPLFRKSMTCLTLLVAGFAIVATDRWPDQPERLFCCEGEIRGDASGDGFTNIADVSYLVSYLYNDGPAPPCIEEADVDASGDKNPVKEDDVWYLVAYFFENGPPPKPCPDFVMGE